MPPEVVQARLSPRLENLDLMQKDPLLGFEALGVRSGGSLFAFVKILCMACLLCALHFALCL